MCNYFSVTIIYLFCFYHRRYQNKLENETKQQYCTNILLCSVHDCIPRTNTHFNTKKYCTSNCAPYENRSVFWKKVSRPSLRQRDKNWKERWRDVLLCTGFGAVLMNVYITALSTARNTVIVNSNIIEIVLKRLMAIPRNPLHHYRTINSKFFFINNEFQCFTSVVLEYDNYRSAVTLETILRTVHNGI